MGCSDLADVGIAVTVMQVALIRASGRGQPTGDGLGAAPRVQVGALVPLAVPLMPVGAAEGAAGWWQLARDS